MKKTTKIFCVFLIAFIALNGFVMSRALASDEEMMEPGNKADCYSVYDEGSSTFFQCMTCVEKTGSPTGETRICR